MLYAYLMHYFLVQLIYLLFYFLIICHMAVFSAIFLALVYSPAWTIVIIINYIFIYLCLLQIKTD